VAAFVLSMLAVPFALTRLPADYFTRDGEAEGRAHRGFFGFVTKVSKNLLGAVLVVLGMLMLVLPGQGLLTLFVGVLLLDIPGKRRLARKVVSTPSVLRAVNGLRRRAKKPPLVV
jgi:hypothetical protein